MEKQQLGAFGRHSWFKGKLKIDRERERELENRQKRRIID